MPPVTATKYMIENGKGAHWHRAGRMKVCTICGDGKPLDEFYAFGYITRQGKSSTRYESRCKPCARSRRIASRDPAREKKAHDAWRAKNKEHLAQTGKTRRQDPAYREMKAFHQRLRKARTRSGSGDDAAIRLVYLQAKDVERIVEMCPVFDIPEIGRKMHVDHIIPLARGGLHVAGNLQILPIGLNMRKGAKCPL